MCGEDTARRYFNCRVDYGGTLPAGQVPRKGRPAPAALLGSTAPCRRSSSGQVCSSESGSCEVPVSPRALKATEKTIKIDLMKKQEPLINLSFSYCQ